MTPLFLLLLLSAALLALVSAQEEAVIPSKLLESVIQGDANGIRAALDGGENIDLVNENGWSAALIATATGNLEVLATLIDAGIDLNQANAQGVTPLMLAASYVSVLLFQVGR